MNRELFKYDRDQQRRMVTFFGRYLREVFRGGRQRWESIGFWMAVTVLAVSRVPRVTTWMRETFGAVSFSLELLPAFVVLGVIVVRAVLAPAWINAELMKSIEDGHKIGWVIQYPGGLDDVAVTAQPRNERYAIATDIVITNHGPNGISLNAELEIQYGVTILVREAYGIQVEAWPRFLVAFGMTPKAQLLFPVNVPAQGSVEGHIAFSIHPDGAGTGVGGDDPEKREYRIRFTDRLSGQRQTVKVSALMAPKLNNPHGCSYTDLARQGPREEPWTRV